MQTFKISNVQEQSYYAIRIFGIVHLIAAIGLVVLIDGPSNGLRWVSWFLIAVLLSSSAYLLLRMIQARAGRIRGHYVLTRKSLAILIPGQPRRFIRKRDCTGFLPGRSALVFRNGSSRSLRSVSSNPYRRDLVDGVCRMWWPGLYGTSLWKGLVAGDPEGTLDLKVDFRGKSDGRDPLLVYTTGRSHRVWQILSLTVCPMLVVGFVLLIFQNGEEIVSGYIPEGAMAGQMLAVFCSVVGVLASLAAMVYIARQAFFQGSSKLAFVVSRRSFAVLHGGGQKIFLRSDSLQYFNPLSGQLFFCNGANLIVAPYPIGSPYNGLLRMLLTCWRPERVIIPVHIYGTGGNRVLGVLFGWWCACSLLSSSMVLSCSVLLIYWLDFKSRSSERIEVSPSRPRSLTIPDVNDLHMQR